MVEEKRVFEPAEDEFEEIIPETPAAAAAEKTKSDSKIKSSISSALSRKEEYVEDDSFVEKLESKLNVSHDELEEFDYDIQENVNNFTSKLVTVLIILLIIIIAVVVGTFLYQNLM